MLLTPGRRASTRRLHRPLNRTQSCCGAHTARTCCCHPPRSARSPRRRTAGSPRKQGTRRRRPARPRSRRCRGRRGPRTSCTRCRTARGWAMGDGGERELSMRSRRPHPSRSLPACARPGPPLPHLDAGLARGVEHAALAARQALGGGAVAAALRALQARAVVGAEAVGAHRALLLGIWALLAGIHPLKPVGRLVAGALLAAAGAGQTEAGDAARALAVGRGGAAPFVDRVQLRGVQGRVSSAVGGEAQARRAEQQACRRGEMAKGEVQVASPRGSCPEHQGSAGPPTSTPRTEQARCT